MNNQSQKDKQLKVYYASVALEGPQGKENPPENRLIITTSFQWADVEARDAGRVLHRIKEMPWTVLDGDKQKADYYLVETIEINSPKTQVFFVACNGFDEAATRVEEFINPSHERIQEITPLDEPLL